MYDVAPSNEPFLPGLPGRAVIKPNHDETVDTLAADLFLHAQNCVRTFGDFHLAVSPSPACEPVLLRLMIDPQVRAFPWARTRVWLCDERDGSRGSLLHEYWGFHAGVPEEQFHLIAGAGEEGAAAYDAFLRQTLAWREPGHDRLDAAILSIDERGCVAGLSRDEPEDERLVRAGPDATGTPGISMTLRLLNATRLLAVLASGDEARRGLERVREERANKACHAPASRLDPVGGELRWYLDQATDPRRVQG